MELNDLTINTVQTTTLYRCANGHEASQPLHITFSVDLPEHKEVVVTCCPFCLAESLRKIAVPMEKVE